MPHSASDSKLPVSLFGDERDEDQRPKLGVSVFDSQQRETSSRGSLFQGVDSPQQRDTSGDGPSSFGAGFSASRGAVEEAFRQTEEPSRSPKGFGVSGSVFRGLAGAAQNVLAEREESRQAAAAQADPDDVQFDFQFALDTSEEFLSQINNTLGRFPGSVVQGVVPPALEIVGSSLELPEKIREALVSADSIQDKTTGEPPKPGFNLPSVTSSFPSTLRKVAEQAIPGFQFSESIAGTQSAAFATKNLGEVGSFLTEQGRQLRQAIPDRKGVEKLAKVADKEGFMAAFKEMLSNPPVFAELAAENSLDIFAPMARAARAPGMLQKVANVATDTFAISLGRNVQESEELHAKAPERALMDGVVKSLADAGINAGSLRVAGVKQLAGEFADMAFRWSGATALGAGGTWASRELVGEDLSPGQIAMTVGFEGVLGAPVEVYTASRNRILKGENVFGRAPRRPRPREFQGETTAKLATDVDRLVSSREHSRQLQEELRQRGLSMKELDPTQDLLELGVAPDRVDGTAFSVGAGSTRARFDDLDATLEAKIEADGSVQETPSKLLERGVRPGEVVMDWDVNPSDRRFGEQLVRFGDEFNDVKMQKQGLETLARLNAREDAARDIQSFVKELTTALTPRNAVRVVDASAARRLSRSGGPGIKIGNSLSTRGISVIRAPRGDGSGDTLLGINFDKFIETVPQVRNGVEFQVPRIRTDLLKSTLGHEFGHSVAVSNWLNRTSPAERQAVLNDYARFIRQNKNRSVDEFLKRFYPGAMYEDAVNRLQAQGREPTQMSVGELANPGYFLSLREWVANQFARKLDHGDNPDLSDISKRAFKNIRTDVDDLREKMRKGGFKPPKNFTKWIDRIRLDGRAMTELEAIREGRRSVELLEPVEPSRVWGRIDPLKRHTRQQMGDLVRDKNLPREERRALARALEEQAVTEAIETGQQSTLQDEVDLNRLASSYDAALKFERADRRFFESGGPIRRILGKVNFREPEFDDDSVNFNRGMAIGYTLKQIRDINASNPEINQYVNIHQRGQAAHSQWLELASERWRRLRKIPRKQLEALGQMLTEETREGVALVPQEARRRFGVGPQAFQMAKEIKGDMAQVLANMERLELMNLEENRGSLTEEEFRDRQEALAERFRNLRKRPFFPLSRFGNRRLIVRARKDGVELEGETFRAGDTAAVYHFDNQRQLKSFEESLARKHGDSIETKAVAIEGRVRQAAQAFEGMPKWMFDKIKGNLDLNETQLRELEDLIRESAPENSFVKHFIKRKGTRGFSTDVIRSYANYIANFASHSKRLEFKPQALATIDRLNERIRRRPFQAGSDRRASRRREQKKTDKLQLLKSYMEEHNEYVFNPTQGELAGLRSFGFQLFLGANIASAALNLTQIPLYTYPYLASRYGNESAFKEIARAATDLGSVYQGDNLEGVLDAIDTEDLFRAKSDGTNNQSLAQSLSAVGDAGNLDRLVGSGVGRTLSTAGHYSGYLFQAAEHFNRDATLLAASRLARQQGAKGEARYQEAKDAVDNTQFDYQRFNRPKFMRGKLGAIFLFKQFLQNGLFFATRRNKGALMHWMALAGASGLTGLPGAEDVINLVEGGKEILDNLSGRTNLGRLDLKEHIREFANEAELPGDFILHGASRHMFGLPALAREFGVPVSDADISGSIGMGEVLPFGAARLFDQAASGTVSGEDLPDVLVRDALGPLGSFFYGALQSLDGGPDTWKRMERALPTALRNTSTGIRWMVRGAETDPSGSEVFQVDPHDPQQFSDAVWKTLSFQPTRLSEWRDKNRMKWEQTQFWRGQRAHLMELYRHYFGAGKISPDPDITELKRLGEDVKEFNQSAPPGFQIDLQSVKTSVTQKLKQSALKRSGVISGQQQGLTISREVDELFAEEGGADPDVLVEDMD